VTLRARWVTLRARWVTLRARWVTLKARWVTLRACWVTLRARWVTLRACWVGWGTQADLALQKNRQNLGRRYLEVFRAKKRDYYAAVAGLVAEGGGVEIPHPAEPHHNNHNNHNNVLPVPRAEPVTGVLPRWKSRELYVGTGRQKTVFERWTTPKRSRHTCTCEYRLQSCRGKSAGVANAP
jgi:hypothetical protein